MTTDNRTQGARSRATLVLGIVCAFGAGMLTGYLIGLGGAASEMDIPVPVYDVQIGNSPRLGPDSAPVTIVLFTDFSCPHCRKASGIIEKLRERHGDDVRIAFKHFPMTTLHPTVMMAHEAAVAAMVQGNFWAYHDRLFTHTGPFERPVLTTIAAEMGMDPARLGAEIDRHAHRAVVERDIELGRALGVQGTPTFFINGRKVVGANERRIEHVIVHELDHAKELVSAGVPADKVYEKIMSEAVKPLGQDALPKPPSVIPPRPPLPDDPDTVYRVELLNSTLVGKPDATITLVLFMDYQCAFSANAEANIGKLMQSMGDNLRVVYKNNPQPRHENAMLAAEAALAAGAQGKFKEMHDKLFANREKLDREVIDGLARELTLDMTAFAQSLDEHRFAPIIKQEQTMAAQLGATSTPTYFINGKKLKGDQPLEVLELALQKAAQEATEHLSKGVEAKDLYQKIIEKGFTGAPISTPIAPPPSNPSAPY